MSDNRPEVRIQKNDKVFNLLDFEDDPILFYKKLVTLDCIKTKKKEGRVIVIKGPIEMKFD